MKASLFVENFPNTQPNGPREVRVWRNSIRLAGESEGGLSIKSLPMQGFDKFMDKQFKLLSVVLHNYAPNVDLGFTLCARGWTVLWRYFTVQQQFAIGVQA